MHLNQQAQTCHEEYAYMPLFSERALFIRLSLLNEHIYAYIRINICINMYVHAFNYTPVLSSGPCSSRRLFLTRTSHSEHNTETPNPSGFEQIDPILRRLDRLLMKVFRPTQSIIHVPLQVNRFQKIILPIV